MISYFKDSKSFYLETKDTTYVFFVNEHQHLETVYYGKKIEHINDIKDFIRRYQFELGSSTSYNKDSKGYQLNQLLLEFSTFGKGDYRNPTLHLELPNGSRIIDLKYSSHKIIDQLHFDKIPQSRKNSTLEITLKDSDNLVEVKLYYTTFTAENIIVKNSIIVNKNDRRIIIDKALSAQLDLPNKNYMVTKLDGAWIRERHISKHKLTEGTLHFDSKKGVSSSDHNPFLMLHNDFANQEYGNVYSFGLIYSGNFEANIELNSHDLVRVQMGINSFDFRYPLEQNESLVTPEMIFSFSDSGFDKMTNQLHNFINNFIVSKNHLKDRPIIINNWEATYFDFNERKLLSLAKKSKKLGIELFCLDDGWFAKRNDDYSSLGDWYYNKKKLPRGLKKLADRINKIGLDFGLWVEPEMISENSELYVKHPDWAISLPREQPALGRNQLILDLTNPEVINYLKDTLINLFHSANIKYVKWDMNRNFSDVYSNYLKIEDQGKFNHLYVMGLYQLLEDLVSEFPEILFESCSSGGNRFDLGMLYYMPQTWTSDDTDSYERMLIQEGTSLIYPLSSISNHVSGEVSHQVLRHTPIESRFNVACFGELGYELDVTKLTNYDNFIIKKQISFYKKHRHLFQYGSFYIIRSIYEGNNGVWMVKNKDNTEAIVLYYQKQNKPNPPFDSIKIKGLSKGIYSITSRIQYRNIRSFGSLINNVLPVKLKVNGQILNFIANRYKMKQDDLKKTMTATQLENSGLLLNHQFTGTGYNESVMMLLDYDSKLFYIKREKECEA